MMESLPLILVVSTGLGFLSGIGIGGGSLLIMYLTLLVDIPYPQARVINLLFFLPSAVIASIFRWKQGTISFKKIWPAILCGCFSAMLFTQVGTKAELGALKKMFGILLVLTGLKEFLYKPKQKNDRED